MSESVSEHRLQSPSEIGCAVITVSDTRTLETDTGGETVIEWLARGGFTLIDRAIVRDEPEAMRSLLESYAKRDDIAAILLTGGTGVSSRDQTYETISSLLTKQLPGYGELFRMLSYAEIGPAAILSRAIGGIYEQRVVLTMPGSPHAVRLAMEKIIVPELRHLVREARR